jgi:hypothetical protein
MLKGLRDRRPFRTLACRSHAILDVLGLVFDSCSISKVEKLTSSINHRLNSKANYSVVSLLFRSIRYIIECFACRFLDGKINRHLYEITSAESGRDRVGRGFKKGHFTHSGVLYPIRSVVSTGAAIMMNARPP